MSRKTKAGRPAPVKTSPGQSGTKNLMDGASFPVATNKTPADFLTDPETGLRPNDKKKPWGHVLVDISRGVWQGAIIPPRFIWNAGQWGGAQQSEAGWDIWITSGEGTPGNYEHRHYRLPGELLDKVPPKHPADWPKKLSGVAKPDHGGYSGSYGYKPAAKKASDGMPWGTRVRCVHCGHFFKMDDLADHAPICPSTQDPPVLFVIACECCVDLQRTAQVLEGYPYKLPVKAEGEPDVPVTEMGKRIGELAEAEQALKKAQQRVDELLQEEVADGGSSGTPERLPDPDTPAA